MVRRTPLLVGCYWLLALVAATSNSLETRSLSSESVVAALGGGGVLSDPIEVSQRSGGMERFYSAAVAAGSLTLLTEFGDKTFFVAAILGAKYSKLTVWWGSCLALWVQTIICASIGHLLKRLPAETSAGSNWEASIPWDRYIAGLLLIGFGLWNVYECIQEGDDSEDVDMRDRDLEDLLHQLATSQPNNDTHTYTNTPHTRTNMQANIASQYGHHYTNIEVLNTSDQLSPFSDKLTPNRTTAIPRRMSICSSRNIKAASEIVAKTRGNRAAFWQSFTTVFAAELGDRSMFSTIALAAAQQAYGVALGACIAHSIVCMAAVSCSSVLCKYISERSLGLIAAGLFFLFGVLSILEGILKQTNSTQSFRLS